MEYKEKMDILEKFLEEQCPYADEYKDSFKLGYLMSMHCDLLTDDDVKKLEQTKGLL